MKKKNGLLRRMLVTMVVFALLLSALIALVGDLQRTSEEEQLTIVRDAIRRSLVTCYAVEGGYPDSVEYLTKNYGLVYDSERLHVYYDAFASNIMPEFRVSVRGDGLP